MAQETDRIEADPDLLAELQAGRPALPAMYELTNLTCIKTEALVELSATLTNTSETRWMFDPVYVLTKSDGTTIRDRGALADALEPGESVELHTGSARVDSYDDPPVCDIEIHDSVFLAYSPDLEAKRATYED